MGQHMNVGVVPIDHFAIEPNLVGFRHGGHNSVSPS
jgi:hypothetical protein